MTKNYMLEREYGKPEWVQLDEDTSLSEDLNGYLEARALLEQRGD